MTIIDDRAEAGATVEAETQVIRVRRRERLFGRTSFLLIAAAIFVAGIWVGATFRSSSSGRSSTIGALGGTRTATSSSVPAFGSSGGIGGASAGTVLRIDGNDVYVQTAPGTTVKLTVSDATRVVTSTEGSIADVKVGDSVTYQGTTASDGSVTASRLSVGGLGVGGLGGAAPGATTGSTATTTAPRTSGTSSALNG